MRSGRIEVQIAHALMVLFLDAMLDGLPKVESAGMLARMPNTSSRVAPGAKKDR